MNESFNKETRHRKPVKREILVETVAVLLGSVLTPEQIHCKATSLRYGVQLYGEPRDGRWVYVISADKQYQIEDALSFASDSYRIEKEKDYTKATWEKSPHNRLNEIKKRATQNKIRKRLNTPPVR